MLWQTIRKYVLFSGLVAAGCFMADGLFANSIASIIVEPTFECAGVIVTLAGTDDPGNVALEVKGPQDANYRPAHPFTRYDNYHMASSLFNLAPGTAYDIRATLGSQSVTGRLTTRPEFVLPVPVRSVAVSDSSQLRAAISNARPGDEIVLAAGNYNGGLVIASSGTADHPIVIRGVVPAGEKGKPVDQRTGLPVINGAGQSPVVTVRGSNVVLDSLRFENVSVLGISLQATKNCVIQGCQITGASSGWNHFVYVNGGGKEGGRHLIQENYLRDTGSGHGYGILQDNRPGPGTVIRRNILSGFYDGINPSGNEGELNDTNLPETHPDVLGAWPNHSTDVYENTLRISRDDDIEMDGIAVNMRVFRNALSAGAGNHTTNGISIAPVAPGPFFFIGNVITNFYEGAVKYNTASYRGTIRNCYFYHNTIKNDEGVARRGTLLTLWEGDGLPGTPSKNTQFKNNIFAGDKMLVQRLMNIHAPQYNPNYWYSKQTSGTLYQWGKSGPYYSTFAAWRQATGQEAQGYFGDPKVDAAFRLSAGSPAIDKGVLIAGVNDRYAGNAPDMGAYEYGALSVPAVGSGGTGNFADASNPALCTVSGYIKDSASAPLPGVLLALSGDVAATTVSDANGFYQFTGLPQGRYKIDASKEGYVFVPGNRVLSLAAASAGQDFSAVGADVPQTLADAVGYPSPWKAGTPSGIRFKNLTLRTKIAIYTLDGALVKEINEPDKTEVGWDVAGDNVGSGVYFCVLSNDKGESKRQKIAVIR